MTDAAPVRRDRLSLASLAALPAQVARPRYASRDTRIGIVHFGPGAFHRVHQAVYVDDLLADDPDWAISAVSLHSRGVRDALRPQDNLYTVAVLDEPVRLRVIGSIRELLYAPEESPAVLRRLADPAVRLVTLTVTEKGYALAGGELDPGNPEIAHDLATPDRPYSVIGYLAAGLRERRRRGIAPYTVLSCDNLSGNGGLLRRATLVYAQRIDAALATWIADEVAFPCSMVDSIAPATDDALRARVAAGIGRVDAWPVQREPYIQWVVEDRFCNGRPPFERAGVSFSDDVGGYDHAKLRLLNGAHSTLAYLGCLMGIETVADAMSVRALAAFVEGLMREAIAPVTRLPVGLEADAYIAAILARFRNRAIRHRLAQIAWGGSQKLPVRLFGTLHDALAAGRPIHGPCLVVAGWMHFVRLQASRGVPLVDPMREALADVARGCSGDARHDVALFLALDAVFGSVSGDAMFVDALRAGYAALGDATPDAVRHALCASGGS